MFHVSRKSPQGTLDYGREQRIEDQEKTVILPVGQMLLGELWPHRNTWT